MTAKELAKGMKIESDAGARELLNFFVATGCARIVGTKRNEGVKNPKPANDYELDPEKVEDILGRLCSAIGLTAAGPFGVPFFDTKNEGVTPKEK
jgi:hypothetical protein